MKKSSVVAAAVAFVLLSVSNTYGEASLIAFDNLSPTKPYYINWGTWFGAWPNDDLDLTYTAASGFTPSGTGYLDELWLGIFTNSSNNDFTLSLYSDNSGSLGTQLWRQRFTGVMAQYGTLTHVSGLATGNSPRLLDGHTYWLTAEAPDDGETNHSWYSNNTDDYGPWGRADNGVWRFEPSGRRYAMRIGLNPVPEPGTLLLMLGGLSLMRRGR